MMIREESTAALNALISALYHPQVVGAHPGPKGDLVAENSFAPVAGKSGQQVKWQEACELLGEASKTLRY